MDKALEQLFDDQFAYKIGDTVVFANELAAWQLEKKDKYFSNKLNRVTVVERTLQECHGGFQRMYGIRLFSQDGVARLNLITEVELAPAPEVEEASK